VVLVGGVGWWRGGRGGAGGGKSKTSSYSFGRAVTTTAEEPREQGIGARGNESPVAAIKVCCSLPCDIVAQLRYLRLLRGSYIAQAYRVIAIATSTAE
jgi:hypothetical protein